MLNLDNPDEEIFSMIRNRDEYMNALLVIPELFRIRCWSSFNKNINSNGIKLKIIDYLNKINPKGYNYCDCESITVAMLDLGYKARIEEKKNEYNFNYLYNVKVI